MQGKEEKIAVAKSKKKSGKKEEEYMKKRIHGDKKSEQGEVTKQTHTG